MWEDKLEAILPDMLLLTYGQLIGDNLPEKAKWIIFENMVEALTNRGYKMGVRDAKAGFSQREIHNPILN